MKGFSPLAVIIIIALFFAGFGTVLVYNAWQHKDEVSKETVHITPTPKPIILAPPKQAIVGILSDAMGSVVKIPWDITTAIPATVGASLYQGDEIQATQSARAIISLPSVASMTMKENSAIVFSNLIPEHLTVRQKSGIVEYKKEISQNLLSVRAIGALLEIPEGSTTIDIEDLIISISVTSGKAKLAYVNYQNITKVWELETGDTAVIDDDLGTVEIQK